MTHQQIFHGWIYKSTQLNSLCCFVQKNLVSTPIVKIIGQIRSLEDRYSLALVLKYQQQVEKMTFYCINRNISPRATETFTYCIIWTKIIQYIHYFSSTSNPRVKFSKKGWQTFQPRKPSQLSSTIVYLPLYLQN